MPFNLVLMALAGVFVNGPYALITTAVAADLGTHRYAPVSLPRNLLAGLSRI